MTAPVVSLGAERLLANCSDVVSREDFKKPRPTINLNLASRMLRSPEATIPFTGLEMGIEYQLGVDEGRSLLQALQVLAERQRSLGANNPDNPIRLSYDTSEEFSEYRWGYTTLEPGKTYPVFIARVGNLDGEAGITHARFEYETGVAQPDQSNIVSLAARRYRR